MSRSNQNELHNPSTRWFDWNGAADGGCVEFYDKNKINGEGKDPGGNVKVASPFLFVVLDQMSTIKGWNDANKSGIWSNEVRNSKQTPFTVKFHKGGTVAQGLYENIKPMVVAAGGKFTSSIYIAFKGDDGKLAIGALQLKGASLKAWSDFSKNNRSEIMKKAVVINGFIDGQKGAIKFRTPLFALKDVSEATNKAAIELDAILQAYLIPYCAKTSSVEGQVSATSPEVAAAIQEAPHQTPVDEPSVDSPDDDVPF
jgi:hypothetical protein